MNDVPLHMRKCADCAYYLKRGDVKDKGNCLFNPPVVQFVPMIVKKKEEERVQMALPSRAQQQSQEELPQFYPSSALPLVRSFDFCHNWTAKENVRGTH